MITVIALYLRTYFWATIWYKYTTIMMGSIPRWFWSLRGNISFAAWSTSGVVAWEPGLWIRIKIFRSSDLDPDIYCFNWPDPTKKKQVTFFFEKIMHNPNSFYFKDQYWHSSDWQNIIVMHFLRDTEPYFMLPPRSMQKNGLEPREH